MSAIETWGEMVRVEHEQSDRMRGVRPTDTWTQFASQFKADPHRTDDVVVEELRSRMMPGETLLDVGAGGGRLALPLALTCGTVTAVEPSPSMCAVLRETAQEYGIANVFHRRGRLAGSVGRTCRRGPVAAMWSMSSRTSERSSRKMDRHARRMVLAIVFRSSPLSYVYGLWEQVHGENTPCSAGPAAVSSGVGGVGHQCGGD